MKNTCFLLSFCLFLLLSCKDKAPLDPITEDTGKDSTIIQRRDAKQWPFSKNSIWNMPIGSNAVYVPAKLEPTAGILTLDEDMICMTPDSSLMKVYISNGGWGGDRSIETSTLAFEAPIPQSWIVNSGNWDGNTPNACLAVLMPDGITLKQAQAFSHFKKGGNGTVSIVVNPDVSIYEDGYYGAHWGSGLSSVGGTLRCGELTPTSGRIRHALKIDLYCAKNAYWDEQTKGYRWPAKFADSYAQGNYGSKRTTDIVKECRMGALLALPASKNLNDYHFETLPALTLAQAFQDYGAYVVDDTAWDVTAIPTEWSPSGRFRDNFKKDWGFDFVVWKDAITPWGRDIQKIMADLCIVDNNAISIIGGGGIRRQPLAPPFK